MLRGALDIVRAATNSGERLLGAEEQRTIANRDFERQPPQGRLSKQQPHNAAAAN
jgi:hypothetical protein